MSSSGKWRCVDLSLTDVSEEPIAFIFKVAGAHVGSPLGYFSTLKMEAIGSFETSVNSTSTEPNPRR
jgi:hypothetical protein